MSLNLFVKEARRRTEVKSNLDKYLRLITEVVSEMDPCAEVYLFGSVAEGRDLVSSDIDVLVVTGISPPLVMVKLWEAGISDPFEIHVINKNELGLYRGRVKLVKIM
ncbi:MAG: nucleotidyltransferase domain-containing protein [Caldivirga sp.]|uniref:nucleotidyltransferase domain-containing protein n=1 Tax=Caldivirga sp. TaxID=2080243 RepID=UPI003D122110